MRYLTFSAQEQSSYETCFLVPQLNQQEMVRSYVEPHLAGYENTLLAYDLYKTGKKTSATNQKEYLNELLPILQDIGVKYLITCDAEYFKTLAKVSKADSYAGYVLDCVVGEFKVIYCPNFRSVFYNPDKVNHDIKMALDALKAHQMGVYRDPGNDILTFSDYPKTTHEIKAWLDKLLEMDCDLTMDIEGFSLKHYDCGIGTISFSWNKNEGIAFPVDYVPIPGATKAPFGKNVINHPVRALLKDFFKAYLRKQIWHNISFDVYVLIYQLFMKDLLDTEGLLEGLSVMLKNWDCTKLITYLATNSCAGNKLSLKDQAQEFAGNYAQEEIKDITKIPLDILLEYNLVDSCSTWFVHEKHWPTLVADDQEEVYREIFQAAIPDIIQMQLTGLPLDRARVLEVQEILQAIADDSLAAIQANPKIEEFVYNQTREAWDKDFEDRKGKAKNPHKILKKDWADFPTKEFNPNSGPQLQSFIYGEDYLALPVIDLTDTKLPATGGETLEKLLNHTDDPEVQDFLRAMIDYKAVDKILTSFIPSFLEAPMGPDGWYWLFGNFNLGGTLSGRLSSSGPNLQNLPANIFMAIKDALFERYKDKLDGFVKKGKLSLGKLIKSCFKAPPGFLFVGLDFASLEDRISALTTKDPEKLKVYTDGYDGHCLRAYSYFQTEMPDIDPTSVDSINSIKKKYPAFRQDSKAPTFALTYQGTYHTLMNNCGFDENLAKHIEAQYHNLYRVSDDWVAARIEEATQQGYITAAFGLRVRTPLLKQVILGNSKTPYEASAEGRTAGNALGQSWCLLNTRAGTEFMTKVRASEFRLKIRPGAQIHDAQYFVIPEDIETLMFMNEHLVQAVQWQNHPDIWHDQVKLGGELSIFYPHWAYEMEIPNNASQDEIIDLAQDHKARYAV